MPRSGFRGWTCDFSSPAGAGRIAGDKGVDGDGEAVDGRDDPAKPWSCASVRSSSRSRRSSTSIRKSDWQRSST
jgi:hypothetical protein